MNLTREQIEFMKQFSASDNHRKLCDMALRAIPDAAGEAGKCVAPPCKCNLSNRSVCAYWHPSYAAPAALPAGLADTIIAAIIEDIRDRKGLGDEWANIDVDVRNEIAREWKGIVAAAQGEQK